MSDAYCSYCGFLQAAYAGGDIQCPKCLKRETCKECGQQIRSKAVAFDNGMALFLFCSSPCESQWQRKNSPQGIINAERWSDSYFTEDQSKVIAKWELELPQYPYVTFRQE